MDNYPSELVRIIIKKLDGDLTEGEDKIFGQWYGKSPANASLFNRLKSLKKEGVDMSQLLDKGLNAESAWRQVMAKYESKKRNPFVLKPLLRYSAVLVLLISLGYGAFQYVTQNQTRPQLNPNAITLQLDNGELKVLSDKGSTTIQDDQGNILGEQNGNKLDYENANPTMELAYNTLTIPRGKRFEITLSDGTKVYLNAGSSIRYPIAFVKGQNRMVFLEGEAFFDVTSDEAHPFVVNASELDVTVLGTQFNVSAYPEEASVNTVLVEGSVSLSNSGNAQNDGNKILLTPGHKAEWNKIHGQTKLEVVDTDIYTNWRFGALVLKNLPFKNIINRLERHYNVDIVNNYTALDEQIFTASFDVETIDEVLASFAENRKFHFQVLDNKIIIDQP